MHRQQLTLITKGRDGDKDISFCLFKTESDKEIKVIITGQLFVELRNKFKCDLETVCSIAANHALQSGIEEGDVEVAAKTYLAVRKKLQGRA